MPKIYNAGTKKAILKAITSGREKGGWTAALKAAKSAGYRGSSEASLKQMYYTSDAVPVRKGKRGRPKGSRNKTRVAPVAHGVDFSAVQKSIDSIVNERVKNAIEKAIAALQSIR